MKLLSRIILSLFLPLVSGCAPQMSSRLDLGTVPEVSTKRSSDYELVKLHVMKFEDARKSDVIGEVSGTSMRAAADPGIVVQEAFENAFRSRGGRLCVFDCPTIVGEIVKWRVDASQEFPMSKYEAEASIKVNVMNAKGEAIFTGNYSGSTQTQHPLLSEEKVREVLTQAMGYAVEEAVSDPRIVEKLNQLS